MSDERERHWPEPDPDELLGVLRRAGWLLEQETASALGEAGFNLTQSWAFQDSDAPEQSREMDVLGFQEFLVSDNLMVRAHVIAECKESTMPFVLLGRDVTPSLRPQPRREVQTPFPSITYLLTPSDTGLRPTKASVVEYTGLHTLTGNPWARGFEATLLIRLNKKGNNWSADNDAPMNDIMFPMAKAVNTLRENLKVYNNAHNHQVVTDLGRRAVRGAVGLYFPIVVTSAPLFQVNATTATPQVAKVPWCTLRRRFDSATVKGEYRVTVVHAHALQQYLNDHVVGFASAVANIAQESPDQFLVDTDLRWRRDPD